MTVWNPVIVTQTMQSPLRPLGRAKRVPAAGEGSEFEAEPRARQFSLDISEIHSPSLKKYKRRRSTLGGSGGAARVLTPHHYSDDDNEADDHVEPIAARVLNDENCAPIDALHTVQHAEGPSAFVLALERVAEPSIISKESSPVSSRPGKRRRTSCAELLSSEHCEEGEATTAEDEQQKMRPWRLGDFTLGKPIGRGSYGNVYVATERRSNKAVAVKTMFKDRLIVDTAYKLVKREIAIQFRLRHKNIVFMLGCFHDKKNYYLVLDYCGGGDIRKLSQKQKLTEMDVKRFMFQLASALAYMHARHVIHRDVKPENLLIGNDGSVKLADFGLAVHAAPPAHIRRTLCGTPEFCSPEMALGTGHTTSVDVWALGVTAYELMCGRTPFSDKGCARDADTEHSRAHRIYERVREYKDDIRFAACGGSSACIAFERLCLKQNYSARPTALELLRHAWLKNMK